MCICIYTHVYMYVCIRYLLFDVCMFCLASPTLLRGPRRQTPKACSYIQPNYNIV